MKKDIRHGSIALLICLLILAFAVIGCTPTRRPAPTPQPPAPRTATPPRTVTPPATPDTDANNMIARSQHIADKVAAMSEVEKAAVVITGNTALVGVTIEGATEGKLSDQVKKNIETTVKASDKAIDNVVVTADPDLFDRIRIMMSDIAKGKPLSGFAKEINEMINRITPKVNTQ